jgi:hypothetical protein
VEQRAAMKLTATVLDAPDPRALAVAAGAVLADYQPRTTCASTSTPPGTRSACSSAAEAYNLGWSVTRTSLNRL